MLIVQDLRKKFETSDNAVGAVRRDSLTIRPGEFYTLLGPSGCGKTTTLRCIAGLERPDSGKISVKDRVLYPSTPRIPIPANQRHLGMVFQSYAIWPHMNVFNNVAFPLRVGDRRRTAKGEVKQRVE